MVCIKDEKKNISRTKKNVKILKLWNLIEPVGGSRFKSLSGYEGLFWTRL